MAPISRSNTSTHWKREANRITLVFLGHQVTAPKDTPLMQDLQRIGVAADIKKAYLQLYDLLFLISERSRCSIGWLMSNSPACRWTPHVLCRHHVDDFHDPLGVNQNDQGGNFHSSLTLRRVKGARILVARVFGLLSVALNGHAPSEPPARKPPPSLKLQTSNVPL